MLTWSYAIKVVESLLEASARVNLSVMKNIWFMLIWGVWDLNSHIWAFRLKKLFLRKFCLRIMLWTWTSARWKTFPCEIQETSSLFISGIWHLNNMIWALSHESLFLRKSWLRIMLWKVSRARLNRLLQFFLLTWTKFHLYQF